jgi:hypothetical protein
MSGLYSLSRSLARARARTFVLAESVAMRRGVSKFCCFTESCLFSVSSPSPLLRRETQNPVVMGQMYWQNKGDVERIPSLHCVVGLRQQD